MVKGPLDPVLESLMNFTTNEDLSSKIREMYDRIDLDESGAVDLEVRSRVWKSGE